MKVIIPGKTLSELDAALLDAATWALEYESLSNAEYGGGPVSFRREYIAVMAKFTPFLSAPLVCAKCRALVAAGGKPYRSIRADDPRHLDSRWECDGCRKPVQTEGK